MNEERSSSSYEHLAVIAYAVSSTAVPASSPYKPRKYYAIRVGRPPSPTIVHSWPECSALVTGFSHAEFKSFSKLCDAESYLNLQYNQSPSIPFGPPEGETAEDRLMTIKNLNIRPQRWYGTRSPPQRDGNHDHTDSGDACYILHDDPATLPSLPLVTSILFGIYKGAEKKPLNALAPVWQPLRAKALPEKENKNPSDYSSFHQSERSTKNMSTNSHTETKPNKSHNFEKPESTRRQNNEGRQQACPLVLPAFCSQPQQRAGHPLFAESLESIQITSPHDDAALSFLDYVSLPKIYAQIKSKVRQVQDLEGKGQQGNGMFYDSGASRTVIQSDSPLRPLLTQVQPTSGSCTVGSGIKLP
jgi:hypothetical protein